MSTQLLGTYGTLMRSFNRRTELGLADRLRFVTRCQFRGRLYDLGRFPGAVQGEGTVHGELFRLTDPQVWRVLDPYEGYQRDRPEASLFVRRRTSLRVPDDVTAWVYWYNGDVVNQPEVDTGNWAAYLEGKRE